jgi:hypothetical protein
MKRKSLVSDAVEASHVHDDDLQSPDFRGRLAGGIMGGTVNELRCLRQATFRLCVRYVEGFVGDLAAKSGVQMDRPSKVLR